MYFVFNKTVFNLITGFEGKNCEVNINECLTAVCPTGKICVDGFNTYECKCSEGYTGENCSKLINNCQDHPCKNNSTCIENFDEYTCRCAPGFTGKLFIIYNVIFDYNLLYKICLGINCDQDINECEVNKDVCNYGICVNSNGLLLLFCLNIFYGFVLT